MKFLMVGTFIALLLISGWVSMRKTRTVGDFFLGGRDVGPWMSAFAYGTTYFSAVVFIGYAGKVGWGFGISGLWIALGNALIGSYLAWKVLGGATREMTGRLQVMTMPEFLEARYDSRLLKVFSAAVIFIFLVPYSASVYMGLSYLFQAIFHIQYNYVVIGIAVLTAVILVMGGYRAVALTDFIQGIVMIFGVIIMLSYIFGNPAVGGISQGLHKLAAIDPKLTQIWPQGPSGLALLSLFVLTSLGSWGLPQMIQKFCAIKTQEAARPAMIISTLFALLIAVSAYGIGSVTHLFFNQLPIDAGTGAPSVDLLIPQILSRTMPEIGATMILLLVLSASMSTLSSLVLVSSSAITIDLVKGYFKPDLSEKLGVLLFRLLCLVFIVLSVVLALMKPAIILSLMAISWGTVAGVFLAPYLYGLYWTRATKAGAWISSIVGLTISVVFSFYYHLDPKYIPMVGSVAMVVPLIIMPVVSWLTPKFSVEHLHKVFGTDREINYYEQRGEEMVTNDLG